MNTGSACALPNVLSDTITMIVNPKPVISFYPSNPTIIFGDAVQLTASAPGTEKYTDVRIETTIILPYSKQKVFD